MTAEKMLRRFACPGVLSVLSFVATCAQVQAATQFFDVNGATTGSGVTAAGSYSWEDPIWTTDATGATATANWTEANFPSFSAGSDANGKTYTVTANVNHTVNGMQSRAGVVGSVNTVQVQTAPGVQLLVGSGSQGFFAGGNSNLKILGKLGEFDSTTRMAFQPSSGSLFLYGDNSGLAHGVFLNTSAGLNFNNTLSFGTPTTPITLVDAATATALALGGTGPTTFVLANPDTTAPLTMTNPVAMRSDVNNTLIWTGHDTVTWTNLTLGTGVTSTLQVGNSTFPNAKMIVGNLAGASNSNLTMGSPNGVNSTLQLTGTSTYGGFTRIGLITGSTATPAVASTGIPALQADEGTTLSANILVLQGGVLQTSGIFNRPLGSSGGQQVAWDWPSNSLTADTQTTPGGGGFSAIGGGLTVNINGDSSQLLWGSDTNRATALSQVGNRIIGPLKFGSATATAKTTWVNPIDMNDTGITLARTITVTAGTGGDSAEMQGVLSNSSGDAGLTKNGAGTLILSAANTYTGATTIGAGKLLANNTTGSATGTGAVTIAAGATLGGTGTVSGAVTNNGIIAPGASVGTLHVGGGVTDGASSSWSIELSGATADKLAVTGNIDLSAADSLNVTGTGTGSSWIIGTYTGALTGTFDTVTSGYTVAYTGGNITLNAVVGLPGDFNSDGKVDAGDYATWRKNDGPNAPLANDNGVGNQAARFSLWRANFGKPPGAGSGGGLGNGGAVPEPSSIALVMLGFAALVGWRRGR